jgi:citrate lyase subunit beta-like protein
MKPAARTALQEHLSALSRQPATATPPSIGEIAVRINAVTTAHAAEDIRAVAALPNLNTIVIPKVNSAADLILAEAMIRHAAPHRSEPGGQPIKLLALIESARAVMDLRAICAATPNLKGLIFGAEDFAQDLSLQRSADMHEMLYARSAIVTAARAFGLESAIDVVCTRFKGDEARKQLKAESRNGRSFGFNGKREYSCLLLVSSGGDGSLAFFPFTVPSPPFCYCAWEER